MALLPSKRPSHHRKGSHLEVAPQASATPTASCINVPQQSLAPFYPINFKRCHQGGPTPTLLPKQSLHSAKTPGRKAPYHRPFSLKPTHSMTLIQDDGRQQDQARHPQTGFLHLPRHLRRLSPYPDSSKIPEIRGLLHPGSSLLLSGQAFLPQPRPPNLHYIITPALKMLHSLGISASVYIDDWLLWARDPRLLLSQTLKASTVLSSLGFLINHKKSQFSPTSAITYLGVLWDGTNHQIRPADKYILKTSTFVIRFLRKRTYNRRDYQRLLGLLNFAAPLCKQGGYT